MRNFISFQFYPNRPVRTQLWKLLRIHNHNKVGLKTATSLAVISSHITPVVKRKIMRLSASCSELVEYSQKDKHEKIHNS